MSKQTTTDFESKIRDICTYHSEFGEGTSGYNLSEEQFQKVLTAVSELVEESFERILKDGHGGGNWRRLIELERFKEELGI